MKLKELARLLQAHPKSSGATVALGKRLLREAEQAGAADAELADDAMAKLKDPVGMNDPDLSAAAGDGFKGIVDAIIAKVFGGGVEWKDVRDQLDRVFAAYDDVLNRAPKNTTPVAEGYIDAAERRRGRKLFEGVVEPEEPIGLKLALPPNADSRSRGAVPSGRDFGRSILNGD